MQTLTRTHTIADKAARGSSHSRPPRHKSIVVISIALALLLMLGTGTYFFIRGSFAAHAAEDNPNCTLTVPQNPLSAKGLATPYQLSATDPAQGPCHEGNVAQAAFVQGAVFDPTTGQISIYDPLVIDQGSTPAVAPVVPALPANAIVALWFGYNGDTLSLKGQQNALQQGKCVNGLPGDPFGQFAYCNAPAFFTAANQAIKQGKLKVPALGKGKDGLPCPTVRDFSIVDQDQSDNVTTTYLVTGDGKVAQMNTANTQQLQGAQAINNASDNRLVSIALDNALGCKSWMAPNLEDPGQMSTALPLNELFAAKRQGAPIALIPNGDPMVLHNGKPNMQKLNLYRVGVDQASIKQASQASTRLYCTNLLAMTPQRMLTDSRVTIRQPSPDTGAANNLFTFLAQRFNTTWDADGGLNCRGLLNTESPIQVKTDANGVAINATIQGVKLTMPMDCSVNGVLMSGCSGTATINGVTCTFAVDRNTRRVLINCPQPGQDEK